MRTPNTQLQKLARRTGSRVVARTLPLRLDLIALGSLLALLIIARGAGAG